MQNSTKILLAAGLGLLFTGTAFADGPGAIADDSANSGNVAWMMTSTALVLFMMIPGLALFYGGLVHKRNVLSVLMHCFALTCLLSVVWVIIGYPLAVGQGGGWTGGLKNIMHNGVNPEEIITSAFQMTFFVITPGLIVGTFVERVKFTAVLLFSVLWALFVYAPICHITWFGGWFYNMGAIDLAGGIVVHITAGVAALIFCIMVGKRNNPAPPHNLPMTVTGTAMLWVGWFGFNGGSQLAAGDAATMTIFVTHISASMGAITWVAIEWFTIKKPSVLGIVTGSIAGLAAITPAAGVAGPSGALIIGAVSGAVCWYASVKLKNALGYDDSLDVVGVHGVGGLIGTLLAAVVGGIAILSNDPTTSGFSGTNEAGEAITWGVGKQLVTQLIAVVVTIAFTAVGTFVILLITKAACGGLRVSESDERKGLDQTAHGENAYN